MEFYDIQKEVAKTARDNGWYRDKNGRKVKRNIGEVIALMHSELSEALEEWRTGRSVTEVYFDTNGNGEKPCGFPTELADTVIRIMDTCESLGINLEQVILLKNEYNKTRGFRHGGKIA